MDLKELKRKESESTMLGSPVTDKRKLVSKFDQNNLRFRALISPNFKPPVIVQTPIFRIDFDDLAANFEGEVATEDELAKIGPSAMFSRWLATKELALGLQVGLDNFSMSALCSLSNYCRQNLERFIGHPRGSYVVQRLLRKCQNLALQDDLINYSIQHFETAASNEFSSRVIECLLEVSPKCVLILMKYLQTNLHIVLRNFATAFVVSKAIMVCSDENLRDIVSKYLTGDTKFMTNKYFKRILVAYAKSCSLQRLYFLSGLLNFKANISYFLEDKYSHQVFEVALQRGCPLAVSALEHSLHISVYATLQHKHFNTVIFYLLSKETPKSILKAILASLRKFSRLDGTLFAVSGKKYKELTEVIYALQAEINRSNYLFSH